MRRDQLPLHGTLGDLSCAERARGRLEDFKRGLKVGHIQLYNGTGRLLKVPRRQPAARW